MTTSESPAKVTALFRCSYPFELMASKILNVYLCYVNNFLLFHAFKLIDCETKVKLANNAICYWKTKNLAATAVCKFMVSVTILPPSAMNNSGHK